VKETIVTAASRLQKTYLFTDVRHICCGDLSWHSPEGQAIRLIDPPGPMVEAQARLNNVPRGVRLTAQRGSKSEPLAAGTALGRVIHEGGVYRSWVIRPRYPEGRNFGCYSDDPALSLAIVHLQSDDGYAWQETGCSSIDPDGCSGFDGFTVFVDPSAAADERYKAVFLAVPPKERWAAYWTEYRKIHPYHRDERLGEHEIDVMMGAVSADGLSWRRIDRPLMVHKSDTDTTVYYDESRGRYVMYTRMYRQQRRTIAVAEAEDFRAWEPVRPLIAPSLDGPLSDDLYTNCRTSYPGEPSYHLMFPMVYHRYSQRSEVRLYSSEEGLHWREVPGGPVIEPGGPDEWDGGFVSAGNDLVPMGDRVALRYHATSYPHKYPRWREVLAAGRVGWVTWPKGRLCAVRADQEGEFVAMGVCVAGRELRVNVRTPRAGYVKVGIVNVEGRSAEECDPIVGDHPAASVRWKGRSDVGVAEGQGVLVQFKMRLADGCGFEWV